MLYNFNGRNLAAFLLCTSLLVVGCKKETSSSTAIESELVMEALIDDAEADITFNEVSDDVSGVNEDLGFVQEDIGAIGMPPDPANARCYTVTITKITAADFPKRVVVDFGTGCVGRDGKTRKGKVITIFTGRLREPGSKATTSFDGYYVNMVHVEGVHTIQNNSTSSVRIVTRTVENGKLTRPNGNYIKWNAIHTNSQVAGLGTPNFHFDDEFSITGTARGENSRDGKINTWSRAIGEPLHKRANCRWFDKGTVRITHNDHTGILNYGDGTCDNKATITHNGNVREITLP